jgi:GNAT superfamily N-acetyltransferase
LEPSYQTSSDAAPNAPDVIVREAETEADVVALHRLLLVQGQEQAVAPVDHIKVMERLADALEDKERFCMLMAIVGDRLVGYLLLMQVTYWFSQTSFLGDFGFYVLPAYRKQGIGRRLLSDAQVIADAAGMGLKVYVFNPRNRRRGGAFAKTADVLGYTPVGCVITYTPKVEG